MSCLHSGEVCLHREQVCQHCMEKFHTTTKENCYLDLCDYCFHGIEREPQKKQEKTEDSPGKIMPCQHSEDVCQFCLEKVQTTTTTEYSRAIPFGSKLILFPAVSSFIVASGALWFISTKMLLTAAKIGLKLLATPTE